MNDLFASLAVRFGDIPADAPAGDAAALRPRPRARFQPEEGPVAEAFDEPGFDEVDSEVLTAPLFRIAPASPVASPGSWLILPAETEPEQAENAVLAHAEPPSPAPRSAPPVLEPVRPTVPIAEAPAVMAKGRRQAERPAAIETLSPPPRVSPPADRPARPAPAPMPDLPPAPAQGVMSAPLRPRTESPLPQRPVTLAPTESDPFTAPPVETLVPIEIRIGRIEVTAPPAPRSAPLPKASQTMPKATGAASAPRGSALTDYLGWRRR